MNNSSLVTKWQSFSPQFLALLRIVAAVVFVQSGTLKLFSWPIGMPPGNTLVPFSQVWFAGVLEAFGGAMMLVGFCVRPVAFVLSGEMAVAYFQAHAPKAFWTVENGGGSAVLFCFIWLYFSAVGAGPWSIDAWRAKNP